MIQKRQSFDDIKGAMTIGFSEMSSMFQGSSAKSQNAEVSFEVDEENDSENEDENLTRKKREASPCGKKKNGGGDTDNGEVEEIRRQRYQRQRG